MDTSLVSLSIASGSWCSRRAVGGGELRCEPSLGWVSQATVCGRFPGFPSAESSAGLGWVGNITFLSSTIVCLNFEVVLSSFQQKGLSDQVSSSKHQPLQTFSGFLWCFCDSISLREQHLQIYNDLKEIRTWPLSYANLSKQLLLLGMKYQSSVPKFCWLSCKGELWETNTPLMQLVRDQHSPIH